MKQRIFATSLALSLILQTAAPMAFATESIEGSTPMTPLDSSLVMETTPMTSLDPSLVMETTPMTPLDPSLVIETQTPTVMTMDGDLQAITTDTVPYLKPTIATDGSVTFATATETATEITDQIEWTTGWYVVSDTATIADRITVTGDVHLILADGATLTASAGITVEGTNSLTIYAQSADAETMGELVATAASTSSYGYGSNAGIGGTAGNSAGTITIHGGNITASSGSGWANNSGTGAGIGGGGSGTSNPNIGDGGTITITGGIVTAKSGYTDKYAATGAGIGGGGAYNKTAGSGGTITIHGGIVAATAENATQSSTGTGAGIGGGGSYYANTGDGGDGGNITIYGGTVDATSGRVSQTTSGTGAGIGGGGAGGGTAGSGGNIEIHGGTVTATAGAGSSLYSSSGAGIGGGGGRTTAGNGGDITITAGTVTATGGATSNLSSGTGAGIGGGGSYGTAGNGGKITIQGGNVTATGGEASHSSGANSGTGAGIGGGGSAVTAGSGGDISITGGTVTATGGTVTVTAGYSQSSAIDSGTGAGIGGGGSHATAGDGGDITIQGGILQATGGASVGTNNGTGAGIGGGGSYGTAADGISGSYGTAGSGGTITIHVGIVTATGGNGGNGVSGTGAGIGGGGANEGTAGDGGTVTINGGSVTATGGAPESNASAGTGAGIGGGGTFTGTAGKGSTVNITDGTVTAKGGDKDNSAIGPGAGIGGGGAGSGGSVSQGDPGGTAGEGGAVTISGGTVTATGGIQTAEDALDGLQVDGAGIGSGGKVGVATSDVSGTVTLGEYTEYGTSPDSLSDIDFTAGPITAASDFSTEQYAKVQSMLAINDLEDTSLVYTTSTTLETGAAWSETSSNTDSGITYQWYSCDSGGSNPKAISSATGTSYFVSDLVVGTYYYYCVASCNVDGKTLTATSNIATVTMIPADSDGTLTGNTPYLTGGENIVYGETYYMEYTPSMVVPTNGISTFALETNGLTFANETVVLYYGTTAIATATGIALDETATLNFAVTKELFPATAFDGTTDTFTIGWGGNTNINGTSETIQFNLTQATIDHVTVNGTYTNEYTGMKQDFENINLTSDDVLDGDTVTLTKNFTTSSANVGDYAVSGDVVIGGTHGGYYMLSDSVTFDGKLSITEKDVNDTDGAKFATVVEGMIQFEEPTFAGVNSEVVSGSITNYTYDNTDYTTYNALIQALDDVVVDTSGDTIEVSYTFIAEGNYTGTISGTLTLTVYKLVFSGGMTVKDSPIYGDTWATILGFAQTTYSATVGETVVDGTYTLKIGNSDYDSTGIPHVGTYSWTVTFTSTDDITCVDVPVDSGIVTVGNATITVVDNTTQTATYTGNAIAVTAPTATTVNGETMTVAYTGVSSYTNVGEYKISYTLSANNHDDLDGTITFTITQAAHADETASGSAKYGESGTVDLSAWATLDGCSFAMGTVTDNSSVLDSSAIENDTLIFAFVEDSDKVDETATINIIVSSTNYEDFTVTVTLTVTSTTAPNISVQNISKPYDGETITGDDIVGTATVGDAEIDGTWTFENGETMTNVADSGTYTVVFTPNDTDTYSVTSTTIAVTITPATITITADNKTAYTGDSEPTYTYTIAGLVGEETLTTEPNLSAEDVDMSKAGTCPITVSGAVASDNYTIAYVDGTLTVSAKSTSGGSSSGGTSSGSSGGTSSGSGSGTSSGSGGGTSGGGSTTETPEEPETPDFSGFDLPVVATMTTETFGDMQDPTIWYYDGVKFVYERGLMAGTGDGNFSPNVTTSRGMIANILYNLAGKPAVTGGITFSDVKASDYFATPIAWASSVGIARGVGDGNFDPNGGMTREQLVVMLYGYEKEMNGGSYEGSTALNFTDAGSVSSWAVEAVAWAVSKGIVAGKPDGGFAPQGTATRGEVAVILKNFISLYP